MARALWLADVLRSAGLTVVEVAGWRTRGSSSFNPRGVICHATAGSSRSTDAGEIGVLLRGSNSAPPPIAQLYLSRTGAYHVVASGQCFHVVAGWGGANKGYGNDRLIGIEAQNDNRGQPYTEAQYDAYVRGVAAICRHMGWGTDRVAGHKEHQPGSKSDPTFDMHVFRGRVRQALSATTTGVAKAPARQEIDMMHGKFQPGFGADHEGNVIDGSKVEGGVFEPVAKSVLPIANGSLSVGGDGEGKFRLSWHKSGDAAFETVRYLEVTDHGREPRVQAWAPEGADCVSIARMPRHEGDAESADAPMWWALQFGVKE